jgi:2-oxoisovalerate dehydrogenase E2 component (dihydrolipoyl transacylase)
VPTTITMPQLGETVTEGTVAQWLKNVGDQVEKYEAFVEVSTDKVNAEVPSPVSGTIVQIIAKEGETVPTGAPIAIIQEVGAEAAAPAPVAAAAGGGSTATTHAAAAPPDDEPVPGHNVGVVTNGARSASNGAALNAPDVLRRVSPAVRRLAREHRVDLGTVRGSGDGGRITANDVLAAAKAAPQAHAAVPSAAAPSAPRAAKAAPAVVPGEVMPLTQARRIIAQRMVESKHTAPHAWTMVEVDVSSVWAWRQREKERFTRDRGVSLTLLPFFIRAVVEALRNYPLMNARFTDDGILVHKEINVGIAVALNSNLIVPVIRDADTLSIAGIALAAGRLIEKARSNKLSADDLTGGTFTVNNTGANGSVLSAPILNGGQAGIVTMETIVKRPVVVNDAIAIRSMMNVCLSLDHRVIDGAVASAFLVDVKKRLEAMAPAGSL